MSSFSQAEDLWIKALNSLNADDLQELVPSNQQNLDKGEKRKILIHLLDKVEQKKQEWKVNRWRYERNGRNVVIIDVWSKITTWITSVIAIIDVAVQYDPAHAALPWAGIRLVLQVRKVNLIFLGSRLRPYQVAVNDSQTQGAVAEGLEVVSLLLVRYELVEQIYIPKASKSKALLVNAISKLYVSILEYLAKAAGYYSQSIAKRLVKSVAEGGIKVREVLSKISKAEKDVESIRSDIDSECKSSENPIYN